LMAQRNHYLGVACVAEPIPATCPRSVAPS
jgi:hypothetical protein